MTNLTDAHMRVLWALPCLAESRIWGRGANKLSVKARNELVRMGMIEFHKAPEPLAKDGVQKTFEVTEFGKQARGPIALASQWLPSSPGWKLPQDVTRQGEKP